MYFNVSTYAYARFDFKMSEVWVYLNNLYYMGDLDTLNCTNCGLHKFCNPWHQIIIPLLNDTTKKEDILANFYKISDITVHSLNPLHYFSSQ